MDKYNILNESKEEEATREFENMFPTPEPIEPNVQLGIDFLKEVRKDTTIRPNYPLSEELILSDDVDNMLVPSHQPTVSQPLVANSNTVASAFQLSSGLTVQDANKATYLSMALDLPKNVVLSNVPLAETTLKIRAIDEDPEFAEWAAESVINAANARAYTESLLKVSHDVTETNIESQSFWEDAKDAISQAYEQGNLSVLLSELGNDLNLSQEELNTRVAEVNEQIEETHGDDFYLGRAVISQIPIFLEVLKGVGYGGVTGAGTGSVAGGVGAIPGAAIGATIGMMSKSYFLNRGLKMAELSQERDTEGNSMPYRAMNITASLYGMTASTVDVALDLLTLKTFGLVGSSARKIAQSKIANYKKGLAQNKTKTDTLKSFVGKLAVGSGIGATSESAQEGLSIVSSSAVKRYLEGKDGSLYKGTEIFNIENAKRVGEAFLLGGLVSPFFDAPLVGFSVAVDAHKGAKARKHIDSQLNFNHNLVDAKKTVPVDVIESFLLKKDGMNEDVYVPADILLELQQSDKDLITGLGIDPVLVAEAAELGHDIVIPMARAQARLNSDLFESFSQVMKTDSEAYNGLYLEDSGSRLEEESNRLKELNAQLDEELSVLDYSIDSFRAGLTELISYAPRLQAAASYPQGKKGYIDSVVELETRKAVFLAERSGGQETAASILDKTTFGTEAKMDQETLMQEQLDYEAHEPLFNRILGTIDRDSLLQINPDAVAELESIYGRKLWAKRGQGVAIDVMADTVLGEYNDANIYEIAQQDMTNVDSMLEFLSKPNLWMKDNAAALRRQRRRGTRTAQLNTLFQPLNPDVDLNKSIPFVMAETETMPIWQAMKGKGKKAIIDAVAGNLYNRATNETIELSRKNVEHLISSTTTRGLGGQAHIAAIRNIKELVSVAERIESYSDRKKQPDVNIIHRFYAPMQYDNAMYIVNMTVKEYDGKRLVELDGVQKLYDVKLEKKAPSSLADKLAVSDPVARPQGASSITIRQMLDGVNDAEGNAFIDTFSPQDDIILHQFIGEQGATNLDKFSEAAIRINNLTTAREMETAGKSDKTIKLATGWERGTDSNWRYEIGDVVNADLLKKQIAKIVKLIDKKDIYSTASRTLDEIEKDLSKAKKGKYDTNRFASQNEAEKKLEAAQKKAVANLKKLKKGSTSYSEELKMMYGTSIEVVLNDEVKKAYPSLLEFKLVIEKDSWNEMAGRVIDSKIEKAINVFLMESSNEQVLSIVEHEIQHVIQIIEKFALGGSPDLFKANDGSKLPPRERYRRLAGEVEARNTMARLGMTSEQRRQSLARETEDVARADQIILNDALVAVSMASTDAVGIITPEMAKVLPFNKAGAIRLFPKDLQHIEDRHGKEIRSSGFSDTKSFVEYVLKNISAIYAVEDANSRRKFDLVARGIKPQGRVMIRLELDEKGDFYSIPTAGLMKKATYKNKVPLWEVAPQPHSDKIETRAESARITGQSETLKQSQVGTGTNNIYNNDGSVNLSNLNQGAAEPRGSMQRLSDGTYVINLLNKADLSTALHELSHVSFLEMDRLSQTENADASLKADMLELRNWLGAESNATLTTDQHEQLARGMELYLREGKAPTANLKKVFARFARWFKAIYKQALQLNVELTDEVRNVFDRMIATDFEIEFAANQNSLHDYSMKELDNLGLLGKEREFFASLTGKTKEEAAAKLETSRVKAWTKVKTKIVQDVNTEVDNMQVYQAQTKMRKNGVDRNAVIDMMGDKFTKGLSKVVPFAIRNEGGKSPQEIAAELKYNSTEDFLTDVYNAEKKSDLKKRMIEERLINSGSQFIAEDVLFETATLALQETQVAMALQKKIADKEAQQAQASKNAEDREQSRQARVKTKPVSQSSINIFAQTFIAGLSMKQISETNKYLTAARMAYQKERRYLLRGDLEKALDANTQARVNIAIAQESKKVKEYIDKTAAGAKKFVKMKKADPSARYLVNCLASNFGLMSKDTRLSNNKDIKTIKKWTASVGMVREEWLYVEGLSPFSWKNLDLVQFTALAGEINTAIHLERAERTIMRDGKTIEAQLLYDEIAASAYKNNKAKAIDAYAKIHKVVDAVDAVGTSLLKVESILKWLDGNEFGGIAQHSIYRPIDIAAHDEKTRMTKASIELQTLFDVYSSKEWKGIIGKKIFVKELGTSLTMEHAIMFGLNTGNESNRIRLKKGYTQGIGKDKVDLTDIQLDAVLNNLSKKEWDFIQSIWDYFETFQKESFDLEEKMTGLRPTKIEPTPVITPYGTYSGGYFPTKYDTSKSGKIPDGVRPENGNNFAIASVSHGSMKERVDDGLGIPLKLELKVIPDNISMAIHNLAFREPVREVSKVLRSKTVRDTIQETAGVKQYKALTNWLIDVAGSRPAENLGWGDKVLSYSRTSTTLMYMGFKLGTMVQQIVGASLTAAEIGVSDTAKGLAIVTKNTFNLSKLIEETSVRSRLMEHRVKNIDRDMAEYNNKLMRQGNKVSRFIKEHPFTGLGYVQLITVDLPTWWSAYGKGMRDYNGNEQKSAEYADHIVKLLHGSGEKKDLAGIMRGGEAQKSLTMFYTFFSAVYQVMHGKVTDLNRKRNLATAMSLATFALAQIVNTLTSEWLAGRGPDEEKDEEFPEWAAESIMLYPMSMIPMLRDAVNSYRTGYAYKLTPALAFTESFYRAGEVLYYAGEDLVKGDDVNVKATTLAVGKALGFGFKNIALGAQGMGMSKAFWDYADGTDADLDPFKIIMARPSYK